MAVPAIVWTLVLAVVKWLSPVARTAFEEAMRAFYKAAMESDNQLDDIAATVLCKLMNIDVSGVEVISVGSGTAPKEIVDKITEGLIEIGTGTPMNWSADRPFDPALDASA